MRRILLVLGILAVAANMDAQMYDKLFADDYRIDTTQTRVLGLELEQAVYVRDHLFPLYFGDIEPEAMARKMTVIEAMHAIRFLLIAFLQGWDHLPSEFDDVLAQAREAFLSHPDELCALIESEF